MAVDIVSSPFITFGHRLPTWLMSSLLLNVLQSVVMPVRNAAKWLPECLQSLLDQSYGGPMELSVFDDGSTVRRSVMSHCSNVCVVSLYEEYGYES